MQKTLLFILIAFLFLSTGCIGAGQEVMAGVQPDKYWKDTWVIERLDSQLEVTGDQVLVEAFSPIKYRGDKPAEDVKIIVKSPLLQNLITDALATEFGAIQPGEEIEYRLKNNVDSWREKVPVGVSAEKLQDDFSLNSFVQVTWKYGAEEYSIVFYDWKSAEI